VPAARCSAAALRRGPRGIASREQDSTKSHASHAGETGGGSKAVPAEWGRSLGNAKWGRSRSTSARGRSDVQSSVLPSQARAGAAGRPGRILLVAQEGSAGERRGRLPGSGRSRRDLAAIRARAPGELDAEVPAFPIQAGCGHGRESSGGLRPARILTVTAAASQRHTAEWADRDRNLNLAGHGETRRGGEAKEASEGVCRRLGSKCLSYSHCSRLHVPVHPASRYNSTIPSPPDRWSRSVGGWSTGWF
jgi:hypothetical protein